MYIHTVLSAPKLDVAEVRVRPKSSITIVVIKILLQELMPEAIRHLHSGVVAVSPEMGRGH